MHHAPCTMAACQPLVADVGGSMTQLRVAHTSLVTPEGSTDPGRTPRRRGRRDRDPQFSRNASGSGRHHRPSRSRSPTRRTPNIPHLPSSPPPYKSPSKSSVFPPGTASQGLPACALCLSTDPHDTRRCRSETLWDGSKARCQKSDEGRLISPGGTTLCSDWNSRRGCTSSSHEQRHECSGCGSKDHGAQGCPRSQKKPSHHAL